MVFDFVEYFFEYLCGVFNGFFVVDVGIRWVEVGNVCFLIFSFYFKGVMGLCGVFFKD